MGAADKMHLTNCSPCFLLIGCNEYEYKYKQEQTLSYACAFRSIHLYSPLLEGSQFHFYLAAQAQNAVSRIFPLLTYQNYQTSNAL